MRILILILLLMMLGTLLWLFFSLGEAHRENSMVKKNYIKEEYIITKTDGEGFHGKAKDGTGIYFKKDKMASSEKPKVNDTVIAFFSNKDRIDGLVKIEVQE